MMVFLVIPNQLRIEKIEIWGLNNQSIFHSFYFIITLLLFSFSF